MLENLWDDPLIRAAIPGLSIACLRGGAVASVHALGVRGVNDDSRVDAHTVFEAASLTKPLVSFIALQLAEEGLLDLDAPLQAICPARFEGDGRVGLITACHVLSHTSGFPNVVSDSTPLKIYFDPGDRFNYGSSAFGWLQRAMETITGRSLEVLAQERVFEPFAMRDSSLVWQERFEANHAKGHEIGGVPVAKRRPLTAAASWSLNTTAGDYARFIQAVLNAQSLSAQMHARWFNPAIWAREGVDDVLNPDARLSEDIAWGLGWGLELGQHRFFHWGNIPGFRAFVIADRHTKDAVVWFANAALGLRLGHLILPMIFPGSHASLHWLEIGTSFERL